MASAVALLKTLRRELAEAGDPARAAKQQAYMKSVMPYHGVANPDWRRICKGLFADYEPATWQDDVRTLWRGAKFREERYGAIFLAQLEKAKPLHRMAALPLFEEMIVTGAWWDFVDAIAAHDLGLVLDQDPKPMRRQMLVWSKCDDLWKRRSAILCQLKFKERTDLDLLYACIEPSLARKEFWLRKAIGWALRELAWTNAEETKRYVEAKSDALSPLSRREALKNLTSSRAPAAKRKRP